MGEHRPLLAGLTIAADADAWRALGFAIGDDGRTAVGSTGIDLVGRRRGEGILGWALHGAGPPGTIDGLPTERRHEDGGPPPSPPVHPNGAQVIDHVVIATPALARTQAALADAGFDLRRTRDVPERALRQAFYRVGEVVLEVVGPPERTGEGPSTFWGLVVVVPDLEGFAAAHDPVGAPREAVQPGRRIATVDPAAGLGTQVAFMSPAPERVPAARR